MGGFHRVNELKGKYSDYRDQIKLGMIFKKEPSVDVGEKCFFDRSADPDKRPEIAVIIQQLESYDPAKELYQKGKYLEEAKDFKAAKQCYQQAANSGAAGALTSLGMFALLGPGGMLKDKAKTYELFLQAAQKGHARAMKNLAVMLDMGDGIKQDQEQALYWYRKAAAAGDT